MLLAERSPVTFSESVTNLRQPRIRKQEQCFQRKNITSTVNVPLFEDKKQLFDRAKHVAGINSLLYCHCTLVLILSCARGSYDCQHAVPLSRISEWAVAPTTIGFWQVRPRQAVLDLIRPRYASWHTSWLISDLMCEADALKLHSEQKLP